MNDSLLKDIAERELFTMITFMAKGKTTGHNGIPIEFFQQLWLAVGYDFHRMILGEIESMALYEGVTKGFISIIPNEGILMA